MSSSELNAQYPDAMTAPDSAIRLLASSIATSNRIALFTGAGVSTESGIPDYRGPNGVWARNAMPHIDTIRDTDESRREMWAYRRDHYDEMRDRQPNTGHLAITEIARMGKLLAVVTQNIDGLHQKAGLPNDRAIELHGSTRRLRCMNCGREYDADQIQERLIAGELDPRCEVCGGPLRTSTVLFGEPLPEGALQTALAVVRSRDLTIVVGSSLVVNPAARLPGLAKDAGAKLVIVNREPTPLDRKADQVILADAGSTLSRGVELAKSMMEQSS